MLLARKEAWADAYRHTPHGKPIELLPVLAERAPYCGSGLKK